VKIVLKIIILDTIVFYFQFMNKIEIILFSFEFLPN